MQGELCRPPHCWGAEGAAQDWGGTCTLRNPIVFRSVKFNLHTLQCTCAFTDSLCLLMNVIDCKKCTTENCYASCLNMRLCTSPLAMFVVALEEPADGGKPKLVGGFSALSPGVRWVLTVCVCVCVSPLATAERDTAHILAQRKAEVRRKKICICHLRFPAPQKVHAVSRTPFSEFAKH